MLPPVANARVGPAVICKLPPIAERVAPTEITIFPEYPSPFE